MGLLPAEQIRTLLGRLKKNGMLASYYPTAREAAAAILLDIPHDATVGVGGSITIRVMGLSEALIIRGQKVYDHWKEETKKARHALGRLQQHADYFLTSTNALTMNGELVNIDASGNRVTSMIFGPAHVIVVAGVNKLVPDVAAGLDRVKAIAARKTASAARTASRARRTSCATIAIPRTVSAGSRPSSSASPCSLETFSVVLVGEEMGY